MTDLTTLVLLTPGFAASESDTTCLPMQQRLVKAINRYYPEIHVVILAFQYPYHHGTYSWFGNPVFCFNGRNRGGINRFLLRRKIKTVLSELHKRSPLTGILSFWYGECAFPGKQFSDQYGVPHYAWLLGQDAREGNTYPAKLQLRENEIIALSDSLADQFEKNYKLRPAHILPPGMNALEVSNSERDIDLLGAGSLIPLKQFDSWIRVVAALKSRHPGLKAVLAGEGPGQKNLEDLVKELGMQDTISFTGALPHDELLELMKRSRILLHPSSYEGFSGVSQEALSAGTWVISYSRPMNRELPHWQVVENEAVMTRQASEWLAMKDMDHTPVTVYPEQQQVRSLLALFGINDEG